jgi:Terminase RNaseH-like domain/Terminase large subunit, T4likevirus-type, N-terminal
MDDNSYNGNSLLKPIGFEMQYTADQVKELMRCKEDPQYFIENYCYIVSLDKGLILFKLYDCQREKVDTIMNNRKVILMEGRQQGKTITSAACILHYTIFNSNKTVAILANKSTAAREVLNRYQIMYENLPLWMQQGIKTWNKGDVELENGSKVFTSATSTSGIRGKSVNWLYIDEAAIIPNNVAEEFFTSTYPTIMAGETTKVLLTSTPLGYNHFWKFWNDATEGRNGFVPLQIEYWKIPGRDEKWAAEQKAVLGELKFNQEVLCTFLGSSNTLISPDTIARLSPISWLHSKDGLDVLEYPIAGHTYFCSVDTSRGVGGDYSAFTLMDTTEFPFKIVAKYRDNKISPLLYPTVIHKVCKDYYNAYVLVEINDIGQQIADIIHNDLEYENMIWVGSDSRYGQVMSSSGRHSNLGVRTTKQIKRIGCSTLKSLVEENKLLVFDQDIISEFSTFIEHNGVFQADEGYHDDLTMTLVLFAWATNDPMFKDLMNVNNRQAMYSAQMQTIEDELTPFGFIDNGIPEEEQAIIDGEDLWLTDRFKKDYSDFISERRWN